MNKVIEFLKEQFNEVISSGIKESVDDALNPHTVDLFGLKVDPSVLTAIIVTLVIIITSILIRLFVISKFKKIPRGFQLLLESFVGYFDNSTKEEIHELVSFVGPYVAASAVYIVFATLFELLSFRPSFASINACLGMGIMTFIFINFCGFKKKKLGRFKRYFPNLLNIIIDLSIPFSLSLRLFGSILSGYIIMELLYSSIYTSFVIPAAVALLTTLLHAFLQAYLFATLTNIFISEAVE